MSEIKISEQSPLWRPIKVPLSHWCNGNLEETLVFELYDYNSSKSKTYVGEFQFTTNELLIEGNHSFMLIKYEKGKVSKTNSYIQLRSVHIPEKQLETLKQFNKFKENVEIEDLNIFEKEI
jgi:hypothetical protein